jgi:hypothetical protein
MIFRKHIARWLIVPILLTDLSGPSVAAPYGFSGTVAAVCKVGTGSYSVSIAWVKNTSARMTFDGVQGNLANGGVSSATQTYSTPCNSSSGTTSKTLNVGADTGGIGYTVTLKDSGGNIVKTQSSGSSVSIALPPSSSWTITASVTQVNGSPNTATYTATVTIS